MGTPLTPLGRISFPYVFEMREMKSKDQNGNPKYRHECCLIFDPAAQQDPKFKHMEQLIETTAKERFGGKIPKKFNHPIKKCEDIGAYCVDGDEDNGVLPEFKDHVVVRFDTKDACQVVDRHRKKITDKSIVYAGSYGIMAYNCYAYDNETKGVNCSLGALPWVRDGDPLGRRAVDPDAAFADVEFDDEPDVDDDDDDGVF